VSGGAKAPGFRRIKKTAGKGTCGARRGRNRPNLLLNIIIIVRNSFWDNELPLGELEVNLLGFWRQIYENPKIRGTDVEIRGGKCPWFVCRPSWVSIPHDKRPPFSDESQTQASFESPGVPRAICTPLLSPKDSMRISRAQALPAPWNESSPPAHRQRWVSRRTPEGAFFVFAVLPCQFRGSALLQLSV
jgi:hypothetical protein